MAYHTFYTLLVMYASRGLAKVRNKSWFDYLCGEDNI